MLALFGAVLCLAVNAFFVAAEFALVKVRAGELRQDADRGDRRAIAAEKIISKLDRYLSVTQFGITVASLGLGWIAEPAVERLGDSVAIALTGHGLGRGGHVAVDVLGLGSLTFAHLLLGELVPKAIAIRHAKRTSLWTSFGLRLVDRTFSPILWVLEHAQRGVLKMLSVDPEAHVESVGDDTILAILAATSGKARLREDRQRAVERVLRFASRPVRQMMVPRVDVMSLPIASSGERAFELLRVHGFSRVLLTRESVDEVVGYLYAKDLLLDPDARRRRTLEGLARETLFVPEMRDGLSVLRDMQRAGVPIAVVIDEYGGTSGIVTIEDLVEEVFGDIRDELDVEPEKIVRVPGDVPTWDVDARATVDDLREAGIPLDESWFGQPIGAVLLEILGHLPHVGDRASLSDAAQAEVTSTSRRRILRVRIRAELLAPG